MSSSSYLVHAISCRRILLKYRFFCNFCYRFSFFGFPFLFLFLFFKAWPATRHPLPATHLPATRHPRKSPAAETHLVDTFQELSYSLKIQIETVYFVFFFVFILANNGFFNS